MKAPTYLSQFLCSSPPTHQHNNLDRSKHRAILCLCNSNWTFGTTEKRRGSSKTIGFGKNTNGVSREEGRN